MSRDVSQVPVAHAPELAARISTIRWRRLERPATGRVWTGMEGHQPVILKESHSRRGHEQEVTALQHLHALPVPQLLDSDVVGRLMLLSRLPGTPPAADAVPAHAAAARWLRALHECPVEAIDPLPLSQALQLRVRAALAQAPADLPDRPRVQAALAPERPFPSAERVWCHRDFTPRNWLWDPVQGLGVVDLEHSRPDHPAWDLVKLITEVWPDQPQTRRAFLASYGPLPDPDVVTRLCWLHGLQTYSWGRRQRDPETAGLGARILSHLSESGPRA